MHALCRWSIRHVWLRGFARLFGFIRLFRLLARVIIRNSVHQRLVGFTAVGAVLLNAGFRLKLLEGILCLTAEISVHAVFGQGIAQLQQEFL